MVSCPMINSSFDIQQVNISKLLTWLNISAEKKGSEYWSCCPFHKEKSPSWQIRDEPMDEKHGLYRCFGCKVNGNAIRLVSELQGVSYKLAINMMVDRGIFNNEAKIPISLDIAIKNKPLSFKLPIGVEFPKFEKWVTPPKEYLLGRGVTQQQIEKWKIGYSINGRLGGRIVFPFFDSRNKIVGYSARTFTGSPKRYLEPTYEEGYKPNAIFGLSQWPTWEARQVLCLAEGVINALAIERACYISSAFDTVLPAIAALHGSNLDNYIVSLSTFKKYLVFSDSDSAGDKMWLQVQKVFGDKSQRIVKSHDRDWDEMKDEELAILISNQYTM